MVDIKKEQASVLRRPRLIKYSVYSAIVEQGENWDKEKPIPVHRTRTATEFIRVIDTINSIISSTGEIFEVRTRGSLAWLQMPPLGEKFIRCLKINEFEVEAHFKGHKLNPVWHLFTKHLQLLSDQRGRVFPEDVICLNAVIQSIREGAKEAGFVRAMDNERRTMQRNAANIRRDISELRQRYRRILAVRIDLSYRNSLGFYRSFYDESACSYEKIAKDREKFLRYLKTGPFKHAFLWCAWKQELGVEKGPHTHFLIFFDGRKVRNDAAIAYLLVKHWVSKITDGQGVGFNCNARKSRRYRRVAIGMLYREDEATYAALFETVVTYMTKVDYYFRIQAYDSRRAFQRSQLPWKKRSA
ncbi:Protein of unknown function (DUF3296) [Xanthomonas bromi]|uniref:Inovirus Gp2 family protein n=1 Tax=Xanthomonas bromi TaxID=56449 RepID=A0A1C3NR59_9XANT|nr:inovirus-type Gp2 protein [Xanthomonas bromi]PPV05181.1 inovirus Gp2 family protein [Xanthomonas bromi]SBV52893.1 Protein of unknown function (DUF3296) [Xanthomonas bromi]